jgi:hypothetical protein
MQWKQLAEDAGRPNMVGRASSRMAEKFTSADGIGTAPKPYVYNGSQWAAAALPEGRRNTQFIEYDGELLCVGGATPSANVAGTVWKLTESGWEDYSSGYSAVTPPPGLAVFHGDLYSVGGYRNTPHALVQRYDSTTGWQTLTNAVLPVGHESWQGSRPLTTGFMFPDWAPLQRPVPRFTITTEPEAPGPSGMPRPTCRKTGPPFTARWCGTTACMRLAAAMFSAWKVRVRLRFFANR